MRPPWHLWDHISELVPLQSWDSGANVCGADGVCLIQMCSIQTEKVFVQMMCRNVATVVCMVICLRPGPPVIFLGNRMSHGSVHSIY